jgi:hypothetical protein
MSATDELLPIPPQPEISEGNKVFHQKAYDLYKWMRTKLGPAIIEVTNLMRNAVTGAFTATSTTSMAITVGEKTIVISTGRSFMPGTPARIARTSDPSKYVDGITKTYDVATGVFVFDGVTPNGTGTFTDWSISIIPSSGGGLASLFTNKFTGLQSFANEVTIASATTIDVTASGSNQFKLTGTEVIEAVTMPQGAPIKGRVAGTPTLKNSATLIVQGGADYVCEAKDKLSFIKDADGNVHVTISKFNGKPVTNDVENNASDATHLSISSTKSASPEWTKGISLGWGQAWQNMAGSRSSGVTYTNTTGKPILVLITLNSGSGTMSPAVQGVGMGSITANNSGGSSSFIVPNGATYTVSGSFSTWVEFR